MSAPARSPAPPLSVSLISFVWVAGFFTTLAAMVWAVATGVQPPAELTPVLCVMLGLEGAGAILALAYHVSSSYGSFQKNFWPAGIQPAGPASPPAPPSPPAAGEPTVPPLKEPPVKPAPFSPPPGKTVTIRGKSSWFGGPDDTTMKASEGVALIEADRFADHPALAALFLPAQPPGTTGLGRRLDPAKLFVACRWDYKVTPKSWLRKTEVEVRNPANGRALKARPIDFGPGVQTGRAIDVSKAVAAALALSTDDVCEVVLPLPETTSPVAADAPGGPPWLARMIALRGLYEHSGASDNPTILAMARACGGQIAATYIRAIRGGGEIAGMFGDMQVKNFLIPVLAGVEDMAGIKDKIVAAMRGDPKAGVLADDFRSRMVGLATRLDRFAEVGEQAARRVGRAFSANLGPINAGLEKLLGLLGAADARFPGAVDSAIAWGGGLLLVAGALGLLSPVLGFVASGFGLLWSALKLGGLALVLLIKPLGVLAALIATAFGVPLAVAAASVTAAVVAIGAAAYLLIRYWEPIEGFFKRLWAGVEQTFANVAERIARWWDQIIPDWVKRMFSGGPALQSEGDGGSSGARSPVARYGYRPLAAPEQKVGGRIVVTVEDGRVRARVVDNENRDVPLSLDRGLMLGMP